MNNAIQIEDWNKVESEVVKIRITPFGSIIEREAKAVVKLVKEGASPAYNLYKIFGTSGEGFSRKSLYRFDQRSKSFYPVNFL